LKILVFGGAGESTNFLFNQVQAWYPASKLVAVIEQGKPAHELVRYRIKRLGLAKTIGQVMFVLLVAPLVKRLSSRRREDLIKSLNLVPADISPEATVFVPSANSPEAINYIREFSPDVILVNGTRIISRKVLSSVPAPFINTHMGITPRYRGVHGGYWALWSNDAKNFGVTVHYVDPGVDTGQIIFQARAVPKTSDTYATYPLLQQAAAFPGIKSALEEIAKGKRPATIDAHETTSKQWFHPTALQYIQGLLRGVK
jgi:folate-dependent phosphoribosylglycinamide formyltransferase PurN